MSSAADFLYVLQKHDLRHYAEVLLKNGYHLDNLHILTDSDLLKMRITNPAERKQLVGLATIVKEMKEKREVSDESDTASVEPHHIGGAPFSATMPTANECCRQATIYIENHRVDRPWPMKGSQLARALSLSNSKPHTGNNVLYGLKLEERQKDRPKIDRRLLQERAPSGSPQQKGARTPKPPKERKWMNTMHTDLSKDDGNLGTHPILSRPIRKGKVLRQAKHQHGAAARSCPVCGDHVVEVIHEGQWQYQTVKTVHIGDGLTETVSVWVPFETVPNMRLDHAWKRKTLVFRLDNIPVDFCKMTWGRFPIRRATTATVPFPTLKPTEIIPTPPMPTEPQKQLVLDMHQEFRKLVMNEEEKARFIILHQQTAGINKVLAEIRKIMDQLFVCQRMRLEQEEEEARKKVVAENFELDLEAFWSQLEAEDADAETQGRVGGAEDLFGLHKVPRGCDAVLLKQYEIHEEIEAIERIAIEQQEEADRRNLNLLVSRLNLQIKTMIATKKVKLVASTELRCLVCGKKDCEFFNKPWKNHWKHYGGALDLQQPEVGVGTLSALFGQANEEEFAEFLKADKKIQQSKPRPVSAYRIRQRPADLFEEVPRYVNDDEQQESSSRGATHEATDEYPIQYPQQDQKASLRPRSASPRSDKKPPFKAGGKFDGGVCWASSNTKYNAQSVKVPVPPTKR